MLTIIPFPKTVFARIVYVVSVAVGNLYLGVSLWHELGLAPRGSHTEAWTAVIAALASAVGGYLSSKKAKQKSSTEKTAEGLQLDQAKFLGPFGQRQLAQSEQTMQLPLGYYSTLARGNRNQAMQAVAPELQQIDEADRSALGSMNELAPRGGASSDFLARMPFRRNQATQNVLFGARNNAFAQLAGIGQNQAQLGLNALSGGAAGNMNLLNFGLARGNQQFQQGSETGAGIYQIIKAMTDAYASRGNGNTNSTQLYNGNSMSNLWAQAPGTKP